MSQLLLELRQAVARGLVDNAQYCPKSNSIKLRFLDNNQTNVEPLRDKIIESIANRYFVPVVTKNPDDIFSIIIYLPNFIHSIVPYDPSLMINPKIMLDL